jgi:hypothetical protein
VICSSGEGKFDASLAGLSIIAGYPTVRNKTHINYFNKFFSH